MFDWAAKSQRKQRKPKLDANPREKHQFGELTNRHEGRKAHWDPEAKANRTPAFSWSVKPWFPTKGAAVVSKIQIKVQLERQRAKVKVA
jgi:hypothetical protein